MAAPYRFSTIDRQRTATWVSLVGLGLAIAWDLSGLDVWLAAVFGGAQGFPLRNAPFLTQVMHSGARDVSGLLVLALVGALLWPFGSLRELSKGRRLWLLGAVLLALALVSGLKHLSGSSCPWDLRVFGGTASPVAHWLIWRHDGGPGHCFPAGHASGGFAFLAGWFAWPRGSRGSRLALMAALFAGLTMGLAQQLRGAHFMSHTLWTAWICWTSAWLFSVLLPEHDHALVADRG